MAKGTQALDSIATLAANLNLVVEGFGKEGGGESLASSVGAFRSIVSQIQDGNGLLHSLIYDDYAGGGVESIERSLARLENILREIDQGDGILHSLIYDAPTEQDLVIEALEAGARLNSILAKIDRGDGTLGLIVNDPTLYEDLKLLVGGANRSAAGARHDPRAEWTMGSSRWRASDGAGAWKGRGRCCPTCASAPKRRSPRSRRCSSSANAAGEAASPRSSTPRSRSSPPIGRARWRRSAST